MSARTVPLELAQQEIADANARTEAARAEGDARVAATIASMAAVLVETRDALRGQHAARVAAEKRIEAAQAALDAAYAVAEDMARGSKADHDAAQPVLALLDSINGVLR
jgi:response regulator RpfG family c-di-GMP phosphodiesterase